MKLTDLLVPRKTKGKEDDLVFLYTNQELKDKYKITEFNIENRSTEERKGHKFWLRNENFRPMPHNPELEIAEGCIDEETNLQRLIIHNKKTNKYFFNNKEAESLDEFFTQNNYGIRPGLSFDIDAYTKIKQQLEAKNDFTHSPYLFREKYMLLNFGEYPDYNNEVVLASDKYRDSRFTQFPQATGKEYYHQSSCTLFNGEKEIYRNREYLIKGKKYVHLFASVFIPVTKISFMILNWNDLPKSINPQGTGTAKTIDLIATRTLNELPYQFHRNNVKTENNWLHSSIRAFLNGNANTKGQFIEDFRTNNFINQAFENEITLLKEIEFTKEQTQKQKKFKLIIKPSNCGIKNLLPRLNSNTTQISKNHTQSTDIYERNQ